LGTQVARLAGDDGLLPARQWMEAARGRLSALDCWLGAPTLFWLHISDGALVGATIAGALASLALVLLAAPRLCLAAIWILYLSLTSVCGEFLSFQWDNLILESAFFALLYAPAGWLPYHNKVPPPVHPAYRFLLVWLLFRLNFESGLAKLCFGDPHWLPWDLTAMVSYYETAPLPTWIGWWVHQLPQWAHIGCGAFTLLVELVVPFLLFGPLRARRIAVAILVPFQLSILLTANYFIFNYLSLALCLPALEANPGTLRNRWLPRLVDWRDRAAAAFAALCVALTIVTGTLGLAHPDGRGFLTDIGGAVGPLRTFNVYHLFAHMTLTRPEVEIQGSDDGVEWRAYDFCYKPGDVMRAPGFVAPHQPRVDFRLWFLLRLVPNPNDPDHPRVRFGERPDYVNRLVDLLSRKPEAVTPLFRDDPFGGRAPRYVRLAMWRYRMTDLAERRASGAWWKRELLAIHPYVHDTRSGQFPRF
jgi:hypothetical protein